MNMPLRLQEVMLGGETPRPISNKGKTKIARLAALGWRIIEVPQFFEARALWHDKNGGGNPAVIDFQTLPGMVGHTSGRFGREGGEGHGTGLRDPMGGQDGRAKVVLRRCAAKLRAVLRVGPFDF
jgi:hypothetical protein